VIIDEFLVAGIKFGSNLAQKAGETRNQGTTGKSGDKP